MVENIEKMVLEHKLTICLWHKPQVYKIINFYMYLLTISIYSIIYIIFIRKANKQNIFIYHIMIDEFGDIIPEILSIERAYL